MFKPKLDSVKSCSNKRPWPSAYFGSRTDKIKAAILKPNITLAAPSYWVQRRPKMPPTIEFQGAFMQRAVFYLLYLMTFAFTCPTAATPAKAQDMTVLEEFVFATDRETVLKTLVPGTDEYYYLHALHYQNQQQLDKVDETLVTWEKRRGRTQNWRQINNRQMLLRYSTTPKKTLAFLQKELRLNFNHQREIPAADRKLPTALDPKLIDIETLLRDQLDSSSLASITQQGLYLLAGQKLNKTQRRELLKRLDRPDFPELVDLILAELRERESRAFERLSTQLTIEQMDRLAEGYSSLKNESRFVDIYLSKLRPNEDVNWVADYAERREYLNRLREFTSKLPATFNSLKVNVLYQILQLNLLEEKFDRELFLEYLRLPRDAGYCDRKFIEQIRTRAHIARLGTDFSNSTRLPPVGRDDLLVQEYLQHYLKDAEDYAEFSPYIDDNFLKRQFAIAKITSGNGEVEKWASLLSPGEYKSLLQRVDIDFAPTNPRFFGPDADVELDLFLKNVDKLIVKVFEINTGNFYKKFGREIDSDIILDGLTANFEQTHTYDSSPALRSRKTFKFPQLSGRGVYVIDFIAGGKSSRALVRKGRLQLINQVTAAGHALTVLDSNLKPVQDASVWIAGRSFEPLENGQILIPFSTQRGMQAAIISQGDFSCLQMIEQSAESYAMDAALMLDRENLLRSNDAKVIIRPSVTVAGGAQVPVDLLNNVQLKVIAVNLDGVSTIKTIEDVNLHDSQETVCEFVVPPRTKIISLELTATIKNISRGSRDNFSIRQSFAINQIDASDTIQDFHLAPTNEGYFIEALGKTGETRAGQAVRLRLNLDAFKNPVNVDLQTDQNGRIELGKLPGVHSIAITPAVGQPKNWTLRRQDQTIANTIQTATETTLELPAPAGVNSATRRSVSLLELRGGSFAKDYFNSVRIAKGLVKIAPLPPGDYRLRLTTNVTPLSGAAVHDTLIRVTQGQTVSGVLVSPTRHLQKRSTPGVQIATIAGNAKTVRVELENTTPDTRVHVIATRYQPAFDAFGMLAKVGQIEPWNRIPSIRRSTYQTGREIGEEYEYILRRKYQQKFPGNMLTRPSLLLNPWAVRGTSNQSQNARKGDEFRAAGNEADARANRGRETKKAVSGTRDFANLDYLGNGSVMLLNLKPNKQGILEIDREALGANQHVRIVAVSGFRTVQRNIDFPLQELAARDSRLANPLDPDQHFSQSKQALTLKKGETLDVDDLASAKFAIYDDLGDVYNLLQTLNSHPHVKTFSFVLTWMDKKPAEKNKLYSKHACHELNFWLSRKDPEFFKQVVLPHVKNKRTKTFIDHYLLKNDLNSYAEPWQVARLNTVERILLADRLKDRRPELLRSIKENYLVSPISRTEQDRLYDVTIRGLGLNKNDKVPQNRLSTRRSSERIDAKAARLKSPQSMQASQNVFGKQSSGQIIVGGGSGVVGRQPVQTRPFSAPAAPMMDMGGDGDGMAEMAGVAGVAGMAGESDRQLSQGLALRDQSKSTESIVANGQLRNAIQSELSGRSRRSKRGGRGQGQAGQIGKDEFQQIAANEGKGRRRLTGMDSQRGEEGYLNTQKLAELRKSTDRLFRRVARTQEWIENNYYLLASEKQRPDLVSVNRFWRDYASRGDGPFLSPYFADAHHSLTEIMFALAVLDLPLEAGLGETKFVDHSMTYTAAGPTIAVHQQVEAVALERGNTKILVSENFYQKNDRYRFQDGMRYDKFVTDQFFPHTLYGSQVVVTNPSSTPRAVEILIQIPEGSIACSGSQTTRTILFDLAAFSTKTFDYSFYFPAAGNFKHYPAHVSANAKALAIADGTVFNVVDEQPEMDQTSWSFVSQNGSDDQVIDFLNRENIRRLDLSKIAFRMKDKAFFNRAIQTLRNRFSYHSVLWSYGIKHNDLPAIREFMAHDNNIIVNIGWALDCEIVSIDPGRRNWYQHKEYWPLINARAHRLGARRKILNPQFNQQYQQLLQTLSYSVGLDDDANLVLTYYLLLQDRVGEAIERFAKVDANKVSYKIQYDYCDAYLDFYLEQPESAATKAAKWADYPVDHLRKRFQEILNQVDEIKAGKTKLADADNAGQQQTKLAAESESIDLDVVGGQAKLTYQNVNTAVANFYEMDIEQLFSRSPFAQDDLDGFSLIRPNMSTKLKLQNDDKGQGTQQIDLPKSLRNKNVLIEVVAADQTRSQPLFANSLNLGLFENYGQIQVRTEKTGQTLPKAYVKVYARMSDGSVRFHKDGYTDLRGRFDYVSQSNQPTDEIIKFSILVVSEDNGATIRQANPPRE